MTTYKINDDVVSAPPPPRPGDAVLAGRRLRLEPLARADAAVFDALHACSHGDGRESVWRFLPYGPFPDAAALRAHYAECGASGDPLFYAVRHLDDGAVAGVAALLNIVPAHRSIELAHIWHARARRRGYANTETAFLLLDWAFSCGYRRAVWKCDALNRRSREAALRLGFAFEGLFRRHRVVRGRNRDTAWFALIDADWPQARANMRRWLEAPGAFSLAAANRPLVEDSLAAHAAWPA